MQREQNNLQFKQLQNLTYYEKLKVTQLKLKEWSLEHRKGSEEELLKARDDLNKWQLDTENKEFVDSDWCKYQDKQQLVMKIMRDKESALHQKRCVNWLKNRDRNSSFFHKKI